MDSERVELQNSLVNEISKGLEQVKQLKVSSSNNEQQRVVERMLSSYEEALSILTGRAPQEQCESVITSSSDPPASSPSVIKLTQSDAAGRGCYKKRKTSEVTQTSREVALDDGYSWRKYGKKELLGSKFPRSYFRCAHRFTQGCKATKQVERSDNDPNIFDVTYFGKHTCQTGALALKPISSLIAPGQSSTRELSDRKSSN